ncbi:MAG: HAD family hydrolase [Ktedonobacterales bacterium]
MKGMLDMFVFFDIGDTLVDEADFARLRHASVYRFLRERGYTLSEEQYTTDLNNLSMQGRLTLFDQLKWWAGTVGGDTLLAMAAFRNYTLHVAPEAPARFVPFPDARATLERLARPRDGGTRYRLGIIANQPTWIRARMAEWGLLDLFVPDCVIISDEVAVSKPQPEIFQFALQQAGVPPDEAVMAGNDYTHDILPAKRLGMRTIWIEREDPYSPGTPPIADPWAADARVTQLAQVPAALARVERLAHGNGNGHKPPRQRTNTGPPGAGVSKGQFT